MLNQSIVPAIRKFKDFEKGIKSDHEYVVLLDAHLANLKNIVKAIHQEGKKVFVHADLIHGLKSDEQATEFICQEFKPDGIISTRANVLQTAKKKGLLIVQRLFLLDSIALETSYRLTNKVNPDYIEVLPGLVPDLIREVNEKTGIPVIAGGLIRTKQNVEDALACGATAVTTSNPELWD
ncbi:glycerol uptake operon antiterminator [Pullulanibacillus pueri]|uniref:Glycerol uptake operon antiterminator regulatory protein n=1 Tax=Pullulanibacillus pueri TaxID=1437324 RepID=A0A8J2ZSL3_9BACL|nr:glycerol-3-phosphate responsive antiterminator [Pullulanibacillus pueri]MBM7680457.1 glycerol uptake operon antiterminator [Pullulanibacillus pueri]GGH74994.1 glycerol uptake operon antiterminator regulatory protein [Pullulanibacillus pueri]